MAYRRGRDGRKKEWTAVGMMEEAFEDEDEVEAEKCSDADRLLTPGGARSDQALSPVLAFFPSGPEYLKR